MSRTECSFHSSFRPVLPYTPYNCAYCEKGSPEHKLQNCSGRRYCPFKNCCAIIVSLQREPPVITEGRIMNTVSLEPVRARYQRSDMVGPERKSNLCY